MPLAPTHQRSRRRSLGRGVIFLALAAGAALLAPVARLFGVAGGPLFAVEDAARAALAPIGAYFSSKAALDAENAELREAVDRLQVAALERDSLRADRDALLAELNAPDRQPTSVAAAILVRPPQTTFDTVVLGAAADDGVAAGDLVLAAGVPVGSVVDAQGGTSVAALFSAPESRLPVTVAGQAAEARGAGDGRYSVELPASSAAATGTPVLSVAHGGAPLGYVAAVVPGAGEATVVALVSLPVDLAAARYLTIEVKRKK